MSDAVNEIVEAVSQPAPIPGAEAPKAESGESSRIEMLIRREEQAKARERMTKAQELDIQRMRQELDTDKQRIDKFKSLKTRPLDALSELDLTYDEITKAKLQDGEVPAEAEIRRLKEEFNALKQEREEDKRLQAERAKLSAQQQETQAIDNFKSEIGTYVADNATRYELIKFEGKEDEVYDLIDAYYTKTQSAHAKQLELEGKDTSQAVGKVMKISEAADKIEEYYEKREQERKKLSKSQAIWGAVPKESLAKAVDQLRAQGKEPSPSPKTLTNNLSATGLKPEPRIKDEEKRIAKIVADWRATRS